MRRKKEDPDFWILELILAVAIYVVCQVFGLLRDIICGIYHVLDDVMQRRAVFRDITQTDFQDAEQLHLFDKSIYDDAFPKEMREQGEELVSAGRVQQFKENANHYTCKIAGTEPCEVELWLGGNREIVSFRCTCLHSDRKTNPCEHVYALLYKAKCRENKTRIIKEIRARIESLTAMLQRTKEYIRAYPTNADKYALTEEVKRYAQQYHLQMKAIKQECTEKQPEDRLLEKLEETARLALEVKGKIKDSLKKTKKWNSRRGAKRKDTVGLFALLAALHQDNGSKPKADNAYDEKLERRMEAYNLEEWQKELVRKGNYDPSDFDDEDLDEDSYYYDK